MAGKGKITQRLIQRDTTLYPDNPAYEFPKSSGLTVKSPAEDKARWWANEIKKEFRNFKHNKHSNIYNHGYSRDTETVPLREDIVENLFGACKNRFVKNKSGNAGWTVFEKIAGFYEVNITDEKVIMKRLEMLGLFTEVLNNDEFLKNNDPSTGKPAKTRVSPSTGKMEGVEYSFPFGIDRTDKVHYTVMEMERVIDAKETKKLLDKFLRQTILDSGKANIPNEKAILGKVMATYAPLRKSFQEVRNIAIPVLANIEEEISEGNLDGLNKKLATLPDANLDNLMSEGSLREVAKTIGVSEIIARVKDDNSKTLLRAYKPPSGKTKAGSRWPKGKGGKYIVQISQQPLHALTKSTGRCWDTTSCESMYGGYRSGAWSDIKHGNAMIWIYKPKDVKHATDENGNIKRVDIDPLYNYEANGRIIMRWGNGIVGGKDDGPDIGVEYDTYYTKPDGSPGKKAPWGLNMIKALGMLLKENGFYRYGQGEGDVCKTPYKYEGYSDKSGGRTVITYDSIGLKTGGGQQAIELEDEEAMFVRMASDVKISYNTVGILLEEGGEAILRALAQNPVIWNYPRSIRRFIEELRFVNDIRQRKTILRLLIGGELAKISTAETERIFVEVAENIAFYDDKYDDYASYKNDDSLVRDLLTHPNSSTNIHLTLFSNHKGFKVGDNGVGIRTNQKIGSIIEIHYLSLLGRLENNSDYNSLKSKRMVCNAPTPILQKIVKNMIKGPHNCMYFKKTKANIERLIARDNLRRRAYLNKSSWGVDKIKNLKTGMRTTSINQQVVIQEWISAMRRILFSPNLTQKDYLLLLKSFRDYVWSDDLFNEYRTHHGKDYSHFRLWINGQSPTHKRQTQIASTFRQQLIQLMNDIEMSICIPIQNATDYGIGQKTIKGGYLGLQNIPYLESESNFDRQTVEAIKYALDSGCNKMVQPYQTNKETLAIKTPIYPSSALWENVRSVSVFNWLYTNCGVITDKVIKSYDVEAYGLPFKQFLFKTINREDINLSERDMYITEKRFTETLKRLPRDSMEQLLTYDFINQHGSMEERSVVPPAAMRYILNNQELLWGLGWGEVASWIIEPKAFIFFENLIMQTALKGLYKKGIRKPVFSKLPAKMSERYKLLNDNTEYIYILNQVARGFSKNIYTPQSLQMRLMLPATIGSYGMKWSLISETYEGDYDEILNIVINNFTQNPSLSVAGWKYLFQEYPEKREILFSNPCLSDVIDSGFEWKQYINQYHIQMLSNDSLSIAQNDIIINTILDILSINVNQDVNRIDRLKDDANFYSTLSMNTPKNVRDYIQSVINNNGDWLEYWRGGTYKGAMKLPVNNSMFYNKDGQREAIADKALPVLDRPHYILKFDIDESENIKMVQEDYEEDGEILQREVEKRIKRNEITSSELLFVQSIVKKRKYYTVKGIEIGWDGETGVKNTKQFQKSTTLEELYSFIPESQRSETKLNFKGNPAKWDTGMVLVMADSETLQGQKEIPAWRNTWDENNMDKFITSIVESINTSDEAILALATNPKFIKETRINSPQIPNESPYGAAKFSKRKILDLVDANERWTPMIINSLINDLLNPDNSFYITRYRNVRPTETIINLTLLENDEQIREKYRQLNMGYIQQIQYWILNGYGHLPATPEKQIDISYVYFMIDWPYANNDTKRLAASIRDRRLEEFLIYQDRYGAGADGDEIVEAETYDRILDIVKGW
jgi:hypothetical protein